MQAILTFPLVLIRDTFGLLLPSDQIHADAISVTGTKDPVAIELQYSKKSCTQLHMHYVCFQEDDILCEVFWDAQHQ